MQEIMNPTKAAALRAGFIRAFVDTSTEYYKKHIEDVRAGDVQYNTYSCSYMRDTLYQDSVENISFDRAVQLITEKERVYTMWDIHPTPIFTDPNAGYWLKPRYLRLYQNDTVIQWDAKDLATLIEAELGDYDRTDGTQTTLPEDLYVFDDSFAWCVIFTHGAIDGERICLHGDQNTRGNDTMPGELCNG